MTRVRRGKRRSRLDRSAVALAVAAFAFACAGKSGTPPRSEAPPIPASVAIPAGDVEPAGDLPRREVLDLALGARRCARERGQIDSQILVVIDYSLPSVQRRFWVLDLESGKILFRELVAHGRNSGENVAGSFSNEWGSKKSSLGLFRTAEIYDGEHGPSLRLIGLEAGVNDRAEERTIVIHGAAYVSEDHARKWGRLGRSWGCPALDLSVSQKVIEHIQGGTALFAYYPDPDWLRTSQFLHCRDGANGDAR